MPVSATFLPAALRSTFSRYVSRRTGMTALVLGSAAILVGCVAVPDGGYENYSYTSTVVYSDYDYPPPPRVEYRTVAPSAAHIWVGGNWFWGGSRYDWRPGYWAAPGYRQPPPRPGYRPPRPHHPPHAGHRPGQRPPVGHPDHRPRPPHAQPGHRPPPDQGRPPPPQRPPQEHVRPQRPSSEQARPQRPSRGDGGHRGPSHGRDRDHDRRDGRR